jgi:hypothetical protein
MQGSLHFGRDDGVLERVDKSGAAGGGSSAAPISSSGDYTFFIGSVRDCFRAFSGLGLFGEEG